LTVNKLFKTKDKNTNQVWGSFSIQFSECELKRRPYLIPLQNFLVSKCASSEFWESA
jgi:hypothetical protein